MEWNSIGRLEFHGTLEWMWREGAGALRCAGMGGPECVSNGIPEDGGEIMTEVGGTGVGAGLGEGVRACRLCKRTLPLNADNFYKAGTGYRTECKKCKGGVLGARGGSRAVSGVEGGAGAGLPVPGESLSGLPGLSAPTSPPPRSVVSESGGDVAGAMIADMRAHRDEFVKFQGKVEGAITASQQATVSLVSAMFTEKMADMMGRVTTIDEQVQDMAAQVNDLQGEISHLRTAISEFRAVSSTFQTSTTETLRECVSTLSALKAELELEHKTRISTEEIFANQTKQIQAALQSKASHADIMATIARVVNASALHLTRSTILGLQRTGRPVLPPPPAIPE